MSLKKLKSGDIYGSAIKYDDIHGGYKTNGKYVNFGMGKNRTYDVGENFLTNDVVFRVLSETSRAITVGDPRSENPVMKKNLSFVWILNKIDSGFSKHCKGKYLLSTIESCQKYCDSRCLRGFEYENKFGGRCTVYPSGKEMSDICKLFDQTARADFMKAADLLNEKFKGHRSNGDSAIKVSSIRAGDMNAYRTLVKEKLLVVQIIDKKEFLVTKEVSDAEETIVKNISNLIKSFDCDKIEISNSEGAKEILVDEQLQACNVSINNGVSYICGQAGRGKTSTLCKVIENSNGTLILTPSHVSREVVLTRGKKAGLSEDKFSVEVLAFAQLHLSEWVNFNNSADGTPPSERSSEMMHKFLDKDNDLVIDTLVIEEASMADIFQTANVINEMCKIKSLKRIIFCGDYRQLPSVSKGNVLEDIMNCSEIHGTILKINHRSGSALSENLNHIITSSIFKIQEDDTFQIKVYPLSECTVETDMYNRTKVIVLEPLLRLFMDYMDKETPCHIFAYTNDEVNKINSSVREALFGIDSVMFPNGCKVKVRDCENIEPAVFHHNDFLEIVQNIGTKKYIVKRWNIPEENNPHISITINGGLKDTLTLGYASSIHSFQGSEVESVLIHGIPNAKFFSRDALYTAVSRGKKHVSIITVPGAHNWNKILYKKEIPRISNLGKLLELSLKE